MGKTWLRQPIIVVLGHVDHGKTTLLDKIRGTAVAAKEPGEITQHVGASAVPASVLKKTIEPLRKYFQKITVEIPGLLFIDTPGHELFSNLRIRGGSVADLAILVVDVIEGFQQQTYECIEILKDKKVPFLVAANKIDRVPGWRSTVNKPFLESVKKQSVEAVAKLDEMIYNIVGKLYELGFSADRFDRVRDFTRTVSIVPVSAKTGEGIAELLALITGLTQQFMKKRLVTSDEAAKGVVLEVKEEAGLGVTIDAIIYDGVVRRNDTIVLASREKPVVTKVRALLMPRPLQDMRAHEGRFIQVDEAAAASGVKIAASNLEEAIAGSPLYVVPREELIEEYSNKVMEEVKHVISRTDNVGVVVKADTLGTLEALTTALRKTGTPIRVADVGPVTRGDVIEASITKRNDPAYGVILAFNVKTLKDAEEAAVALDVRIFSHNIIYRLVEEYSNWVNELRRMEKMQELNSLVRPGKVRIIPGYVFRRSDPAIVGVEVLGGVIKPGYPLMRSDGVELGSIMQIRDRDNVLKEARTGAQVAISIRGRVMIGRHVDEGDFMFTDIPREHVVKLLKRFKDELSDDELIVLKEIIDIKRKQDPVYGVLI